MKHWPQMYSCPPFASLSLNGTASTNQLIWNFQDLQFYVGRLEIIFEEKKTVALLNNEDILRPIVKNLREFENCPFYSLKQIMASSLTIIMPSTYPIYHLI